MNESTGAALPTRGGSGAVGKGAPGGQVSTATWPLLAAAVAAWWGSTGILIATQRNDLTRSALLLCATVLGALGIWLIRRSAPLCTSRDAALSFVGGALLLYG